MLSARSCAIPMPGCLPSLLPSLRLGGMFTNDRTFVVSQIFAAQLFALALVILALPIHPTLHPVVGIYLSRS